MATQPHIIERGDQRYPVQLAQVLASPPPLHVIGNASLLLQPQVAIVGSRHPTAAGARIARIIASELAAAGFIITSGLARGIDAAAHEAVLAAGGKTIAVCGCGLDICYPAVNRALHARIARDGLLVSEFPPGTPPRAQHFPQRNRIISGLARGVVVVEAASGSGSLITAQRALEQGREVFAIPGSPLNPQAAGCLSLIRQGATLARGAADILPDIGIAIECAAPRADPSRQPCQASRPDGDYALLLDALGFEPASIDDLVARTGLPPGALSSMMLILELEGRVEGRPGALYARIH